MTYEDAFEYCMKKAQIHFSKLNGVLFSPYESFDGEYYEHYPNWDFVTSKECWATSMITGLASLALETGKNTDALKWANQFKKEYYEKVFSPVAYTMHDLGLLYVPYSVHLWQITGDKEHKMTALKAAEVLAKRFNIYGRYIEPWKYMNDLENPMGRIVITSAANVSLLYWSWKETGHRFYLDVANGHLETLIKQLVREDYSTAYGWICDSVSGEFLKEIELNDFPGRSHWARGSAWLVFGLAVAYSYTQKEHFLEMATRIGEKYLECLHGKLIPVWDFRLPSDAPALARHIPKNHKPHWDETKDENTIYNVDSSAAAIMCCAFLILNSLKKNARFAQYADATLQELADHYLVSDMQKEAMLSRSDGRDAYRVHGDYFFAYALAMKLYGTTGPWGQDLREEALNKNNQYGRFIFDEISDQYIADSKISKIIKYISDHLDQPLTVSELAEEFHFHPSHLNRIFKKTTGVTPALYVKTKKMNTAKWYLENSDLSIHEIMKIIGESDQAMFSKSFKRFFALSPKEYRKQKELSDLQG